MSDTPQAPSAFLSTAYRFLRPEARILDLGAGAGIIARRMAELGGRVIAVDRQLPVEPVDSVTWERADVQDYVQRLSTDASFDIILLRNLIQFLPFVETVDDFLPRLMLHFRPGGVLAIATFYREPQPPFEKPFASLYTLNDLRHVVKGWSEVFGDEHRYRGPDMRGEERFFFSTELIVQCPK